MKLLDTWAWIEYFNGSEKGKKIKSILDEHYVAISAISLAELSKWFFQNKKSISFKTILYQIKKHSIILPLDESILIESGKNYISLRKTQKNIGMIDSIIYTTADLYGYSIITGDQDFKGLPNVEII